MTEDESWRRATARRRTWSHFRSGCRRRHRQGSKSAIVRTSPQLKLYHESTTSRTHPFLSASRWPRSPYYGRLKVSQHSWTSCICQLISYQTCYSLVSVCLSDSVCMSVCLWAGLIKKLWTIFHNIFKGQKSIKFCGVFDFLLRLFVTCEIALLCYHFATSLEWNKVDILFAKYSNIMTTTSVMN